MNKSSIKFDHKIENIFIISEISKIKDNQETLTSLLECDLIRLKQEKKSFTVISSLLRQNKLYKTTVLNYSSKFKQSLNFYTTNSIVKHYRIFYQTYQELNQLY